MVASNSAKRVYSSTPTLADALSSVEVGTVTQLASTAFQPSTLKQILGMSNVLFAAPQNRAFTPDIVKTYGSLNQLQQQDLLASHFGKIPDNLKAGTTYTVPTLGSGLMTFTTDANAKIASINGANATQLIPTQNGSYLASIGKVLLPGTTLITGLTCVSS